MHAALAPLQGGLGSLENYIRAVNQIPMLSADEETRLAERLCAQGDLDAARTLVMSHLRFVVSVARGYRGYGLPQADLIQEGNVGLMKAVKRFDPARGVRLVSFAAHWIRASIHEFILRNWRIVKLATTKAQRKLFFNLRSTKKSIGWMHQNEIQEIAHTLGVKPEEVEEMEKRMSAGDVPLESRNGGGDEDYANTMFPMLYLEDQHPTPDEQLENTREKQRHLTALTSAMGRLDKRSQNIVARRWLSETKSTLHELATEYGISPERVRQIEAAAMQKMRCAMQPA
ncbi:MAG: RNA polymerase sigma factor RpoH [Candidatus Eutrophobiaceae bacterium]